MGRDWPVRFRRAASMDDGATGYCNYGPATIDILTPQTPFDTRDTYLHEVFHAILYQQGRETYGNEEEELYVRALATGLMGVLQDNPEFAKWLIQPITTP